MNESEYKIRSLGELQRALERHERFNDSLILPDMRLVVRIDARRYAGPWRKNCGIGEDAAASSESWDYPYDPAIADAFLSTACNLMSMGLHVQLALVHGDEISLLLDPCESVNPRRRSALLSLVASAASLHFREYFPCSVIFHGVLSELPTTRHIFDYFFWQRFCFVRNVLSQALHRVLGDAGHPPKEIDARMNALTLEERVVLAREHGFDFQAQPAWKKYGAAVWWDQNAKGLIRAETNQEEIVDTQSLIKCRTLPEHDNEFFEFLCLRVSGDGGVPPLGRVGVRTLEKKLFNVCVREVIDWRDGIRQKCERQPLLLNRVHNREQEERLGGTEKSAGFASASPLFFQADSVERGFSTNPSRPFQHRARRANVTVVNLGRKKKD